MNFREIAASHFRYLEFLRELWYFWTDFDSIFFVCSVWKWSIKLFQGRSPRLGSRGLSPGTFWDLLNGSFFQIAQKCNKKLHEKIVPPWAPPLFRQLLRPWIILTRVFYLKLQSAKSKLPKKSHKVKMHDFFWKIEKFRENSATFWITEFHIKTREIEFLLEFCKATIWHKKSKIDLISILKCIFMGKNTYAWFD